MSGATNEPVNKSMDRDLLRSPADVHRHFCSTDVFEVVASQQFFDNGKTYRAWPDDPEQKYSFGAIFLRKRVDR